MCKKSGGFDKKAWWWWGTFTLVSKSAGRGPFTELVCVLEGVTYEVLGQRGTHDRLTSSDVQERGEHDVANSRLVHVFVLG